MTRLILALALASFSFVAVSAPPVLQPVAVNVTNPVLPVEVSNADPIPVVETNEGQQFEVWVEFSASGCSFNCFNHVTFTPVIVFDLAPVPAGKRWVITRIDGQLPYSTTQARIGLQSTTVISFQQIKAGFHGPFFPWGTGLVGFSTDVLTSYGPGEIPHVNIAATSAPTNFVGYVTFSGYLIDAP